MMAIFVHLTPPSWEAQHSRNPKFCPDLWERQIAIRSGYKDIGTLGSVSGAEASGLIGKEC